MSSSPTGAEAAKPSAVLRLRARFCILALGFLSASATVVAAGASEILVGSGEFPPYTSEKKPDRGCVISIVKGAYQAEGQTVEVEFMPWPRNLVALSRGQIDASAYWYPRVDRRKEFIFPKSPVAHEVYKFVFPKDAIIHWETFEELRGKTIVVNSGYTYTDEFLGALKDFEVKIRYVATEDQNLRMVLRGRADLTIVNEKVLAEYLQEMSDDDQSKLYVDDRPAFTVYGYLMFSRSDAEKSKKLAEMFDKGYEKIRHTENLRAPFETCGLFRQ
jgi:polar amino acid transport system substrate-binding protein